MALSQISHRGLTSAEAAERLRRGLGNRGRRQVWTDYLPLFRRHLFTLFNFIVVPAAFALFYHGQWQAGISVTCTALANAAIGLFQECRAKRRLDRLAILTENKAQVIRDGQPGEISARDVVQGDAILLRAGDTVIADGELLDAHFLELDEALLTGESDPLRRKAGDTLLSGSICVTGEGCYRADKVGDQAFAQSISSAGRHYRDTSSAMTRIINWIITVLSATALALCALYFALYWLKLLDGNHLVMMIAATIISMVPQGLVLTATISFAVGAIVVSQRGALVQRLNAVEAMAAVDVICTDKTGTLTTNRLRLAHKKILSVDMAEAEVDRLIALFAWASIDRRNRNIEALRAAFPKQVGPLLDQIPFKSQNRFSAIRLSDGQCEHVLVLGAPEALIKGHISWQADLQKFQEAGLRVLLFAEARRHESGPMSFANDALPEALELLALLALADELRQDAAVVLRALSAQGIAFKVISGDNPETVRATVAQLDVPFAHDPIAGGADLAQTADVQKFVESHTLFGRIEPRQKVQIIQALQKAGRHVAMIGDGVNDVLPIKGADLGIAMGEGCQAAKTVSGLVLENNDFAMLPPVLEEGRTIVRNVRRAAKLFLVKNVYSLLMLLFYASGLLGLAFPYLPQQVSLLNWLVIGIPAVLIALTRERSLTATKISFGRDVGWFAARTGIVFGVAGIVMLALSKHLWDHDELTQRSMLLTVLVLLGMTNLWRALSDGGNQILGADRRLIRLSLVVIPAYLAAMYWPMSARFFQLTPFGVVQWLEVLAVTLPAYGLSLLSDRIRFKR
jgi:cation-transporting ATPase E